MACRIATLWGSTFSSVPLDALEKFLLEADQLLLIFRPHVELHPGVERYRIHRRSTTYPADVIGRLRVLRYFHLGEQSHHSPECARRINTPEIEEAVAAGAADGHAVSPAADLSIENGVRAIAVDGDERVNSVVVLALAYKVL